MEWLFVYENGGWWLKIDNTEQLTEYHKKTDRSRYEGALKMYTSGERPENMSLEELKKARNFNRAAVSLIILLLCFMASMLLCIKRQEESFRHLETRYEELREELIGTDYGE